jgi:hypothetical protein
MASKEHKIVRKAQVMAELSRLSGLLAERFKLEAPELNATNRDAELAEIQRIEGINGLLIKLMEANEAQVAVKRPSKPHGANK